MKKTFSILSLITLLIFSNLAIKSCGSTEDTVSCFPNSPINVILTLNSMPLYNSELQNQQWTYVDMDGAGTRGLIVAKTNNGYKAYDRNAPHICPDSDTTLKVEFPYIVCPKDNAKWILLTGQPTAVASVQPKTYFCDFNQATNTITIYNQ